MPGYTKEDVLGMLRQGTADAYDSMVIANDGRGQRPIAQVISVEDNDYDVWNPVPQGER